METYYHPHDLAKFAETGKGNKDLRKKFMAYYSAVFAEGAYRTREGPHCPCRCCPMPVVPLMRTRRLHLKKGRNIDEMTEAIHVACAIRRGASLAHGVQIRNVADKLSM